MSNPINLGIDYLIDLKLLGRGGFSMVYAATDTRFDRQVAVKVLDVLSDKSTRRRFERECRLMGRLSSHPNVVTVFDSGYGPTGAPHLIMELATGGSLADWLEQRGPLPWQEAVDLIIPIAGALAAAHESNILHRDVKPANILMADDTVKLTDFGISSFRDSSGATSANIAASWLHTPPETFPNLRDARSDLYSLGSTLYTLVVGTPPLWRDGEDSIEPLMYRILHEPVSPIPPAVAPAALSDVLAWALAKDPDQRPQTAAEFAAALTSVRAGTELPKTVRVPAPVPPVDPSQPPLLLPKSAQDQSSRGWGTKIALPAAVVFAIGATSFVALSGGRLPFTSTTPEAAAGTEITPEDESIASPTSSSATSPSTSTNPSTTVSPGPTATAGSADEAPSTTAPPTTAPTTTDTTASPVAASQTFASYNANGVGTPSNAATEFFDFLADHSNEIVELNVTVTLESIDSFSEGQMTLWGACADTYTPAEDPRFHCDGYSLRFLNESAGTSSVGWQRGEEFLIFGYFSIGPVVGPNQGILTLPMDPVATADALAAGGS